MHGHGVGVGKESGKTPLGLIPASHPEQVKSKPPHTLGKKRESTSLSVKRAPRDTFVPPLNLAGRNRGRAEAGSWGCPRVPPLALGAAEPSGSPPAPLCKHMTSAARRARLPFLLLGLILPGEGKAGPPACASFQLCKSPSSPRRLQSSR